jgi:hypothetical protein
LGCDPDCFVRLTIIYAEACSTAAAVVALAGRGGLTPEMRGRLPRSRLSSDLSIVPELKFQLFDHLGQPLSREGIGGFQSKPAGLLQLPFQCLTVHPRHLIAPANWVSVWGSSGTSPTRE